MARGKTGVQPVQNTRSDFWLSCPFDAKTQDTVDDRRAKHTSRPLRPLLLELLIRFPRTRRDDTNELQSRRCRAFLDELQFEHYCRHSAFSLEHDNLSVLRRNYAVEQTRKRHSGFWFLFLSFAILPLAEQSALSIDQRARRLRGPAGQYNPISLSPVDSRHHDERLQRLQRRLQREAGPE